MTPDPLDPEHSTSARRQDPEPTVTVPVGLDPAVPHGLVILVAQGDKISRLIASHEVEVEAFLGGVANLRVVVFDPRKGAPPFAGAL